MEVKAKKMIDIKVNIEITGITLLSLAEYREYGKKIPFISEWWWLREPGDESYLVMFARNAVDRAGGFVGDDDNAVRPVLLGKFGNFIEFEFAGYSWVILSDNMAICKDFIGYHRFDKESNNYEKSEIKEYLETWLKTILKYSE